MTGSTENHISGGVFFGFVIQGRTVNVTLPDRPDPALAGLPRRSPTFTGRHPQLEQILSTLEPTGQDESVDTVVVTGLAGVGKTELMLQAGHRALRNSGWFPGGVLFVDLHGYDSERRVSPKNALATLLRALGIPPELIPPGIAERALIYRDALRALADAGRRVLVVLDDVPASGKIRYLLPGNGSAATLVSSRHSLTELDALAVTLEELSTDAGRDLLDGVLRTALPGDSRIADETDAAGKLVALCGGLPLALRILASLLVDVPSRRLSHLSRDLEDVHSRLSLLSREKRAVTAAFDLSYRRLTKAQAKFFRFMSLHPAQEFSTESAAQLYGVSNKEAERLLLDLARRHLVEPREPYGRWRLHGLVRLHSRKRLKSSHDSWGENLMQLFVHFHERATLACEMLFSPAAPVAEGGPFLDRSVALQWLETERRTLVSAVCWAHAAEDDFMCVALGVPVSQFLAEARYLDDARLVLTAGVVSAERQKDGIREAQFLSALGVVLRDMRKLRKSVRVHRRAIEICRSLKKHRALAGVLNNLGLTLHEQRKFKKAVLVHKQAVRLFGRSGDRIGAACALSNTAETLFELDRLPEALSAFRDAAKIFRKQGDLRGYSQVLGGMAKVKRSAGKADRALELHRRALELPDGLLVPHARAVELANFGNALREVGDFDSALTAQQEALDTFRRLGDRRGVAMVLGNMALARQSQGKLGKALRLHTLALEAFVEGKDDQGLAIELGSLASTLLQVGRNTEALKNLELAADLYHQTGDREREDAALDAVDRLRGRLGAASPTGPALPSPVL
ncbi:tetratricopeptide repeat protein [Streptomyces sp. NPDC091040]|uniref:tetratricopeptide repeat protein n=1 Tax=Streptomyces sp. NPDC091040 TaxID=3365972 RepID=UPI00381B3C6B